MANTKTRNEQISLYRRIRKFLSPLRIECMQLQNRLRIALRYYLFPRHNPRIRLFIVAEPRTGSNMLVSYLSSLPGTSTLPELLNTRTRIGIRRNFISRNTTLRHIDHLMNRPGDIVSGKLMIHHLNWHHIEPKHLLARNPDYRFIVLYRKDLLRQYVSFKLLKMTGQHLLKEGQQSKQQPVTACREEFINFCEGMKSRYREFLRQGRFSSEQCVILSYEDLSGDAHDQFYHRLRPLLGIAGGDVQTTTRRQSSVVPKDQILNFDEIRDIVESGAAWFELEESLCDERSDARERTSRVAERVL